MSPAFLLALGKEKSWQISKDAVGDSASYAMPMHRQYP